VELYVNAAAFVLLAIWVGEPLPRLLGIFTAALTATGGIALIYESIPLMRGTRDAPAADDGNPSGNPEPAVRTARPRSVLFTPITFP
jgi:multiple antibiotic resistance protein